MKTQLKLTGDERLPSGSVFHWGERDPDNIRRVMVTCGGCGQKRFCNIANRYRCSGLCLDCSGYRRRDDDDVLPSGSIIHWGERDPDNYMRVMVTCGHCKQKYLKPVQYRTRWTGMCKRCVFRRPPEDEVLPSGSIIHWGERDPDDARQVMVTCGCCNQKRLTTPGRGKMLQKWSGFCLKCTAAPRRKSADEVLPSGSIIHWGERNESDEGRVPVTCGICNERRLTKLPAGQHRRKSWSGFCPSHSVAELVQRLRQAPPTDGQANGESRERFDRTQFKSDLDCAIDDQIAQGTPSHKITRKKITGNYPLGGEYINPDALTKRMRRSGIELSFDDYVESRVKLKP